jgi:hypothetical protein
MPDLLITQSFNFPLICYFLFPLAAILALFFALNPEIFFLLFIDYLLLSFS